MSSGYKCRMVILNSLVQLFVYVALNHAPTVENWQNIKHDTSFQSQLSGNKISQKQQQQTSDFNVSHIRCDMATYSKQHVEISYRPCAPPPPDLPIHASMVGNRDVFSR